MSFLRPRNVSRRVACAFACAFACVLSAGIGTAQQSAVEARHVLALSDQHVDDRSGEEWSPTHVLWQTPLNFLGMAVTIRDLEEGPPADLDGDITRAVLVHLSGSEDAPDWLLPWLQRQRSRSGVRILHVGTVDRLSSDNRALAQWFGGFGLTYRQNGIDNPLRVVWHPESDAVCAYEATPPRRRHVGPVNAAPTNRVWVRTEDVRTPGDDRAPVVSGSWGCVALDPWVVSVGVAAGDRRWHMDPFALLRDALGLEGIPVPDPSVAWGRRKFILHIDGDGFESMSTAMPGHNAAAAFADRVMDTTRIPMTLSVIVRSVTDDIAVEQPDAAIELARRMLACPWVESASHTVLHPLDWRGRVRPRMLPRSVVWYDDGSIANYTHDMRAEVVESVRFINRMLAPEGRPCRLLLWSGQANPTREVIAACAEVGCLNLNGGVYRWDASQPSLAYVQPWGLQLGDQFQVYCGAANENVFDGFYSTLPSAFGHIHETLENTGSPRILKPANIYAHFYSAEHEPRLRALLELIEEWSVRRKTVPVFATEYAAAVADAQKNCFVGRTRDGFVLHGFEGCRTVRVDGFATQTELYVDWQRSLGVAGANLIGDALYLQLADSHAEVVWSDAPVLLPHLIEADHDLAEVRRSALGISWRSNAFRTRKVVVGGLPADCEIVYRLDAGTASGRTDWRGRLEVVMKGGGNSVVEIETP